MKGWVQTVLAVVCAVSAFLLILVIFLCWRLYVMKKRQKFFDDLQSSRKLLLESKPTLKAVSINQNSYGDDSSLQDNLSSLTFQQEPHFPHLEFLKSQENYDSPFTDTECETDLVDPNTRPKTRIHQLQSEDSDSSRPDTESNLSDTKITHKKTPVIEFSIVYVSSINSLTVHIIRVANLPVKYRKNCSSYVKVSLLARKKSSHSTSVSKKSLNPEYEENFSFEGYTLKELTQFTLRLSVYVKLFHSFKNRLIGDLWLPLSQLDLTPDVPQIISEKLSPLKTSRSKLQSVDLGQLFVMLQYQPEADRLKVMVRKAENLKRPSGVSIGLSEYYVIISLLRGIEAVTYKETRPASGPNPVWNQPFLFDIPETEVHQYSLQFLVMLGRIYSRDGVVGQVLVGPGSTPLGIAHWNEAISPSTVESAKWHNIVQADKY
ncbi:synaptotagmin-7-like [Limulus polyphemus]|uniref:Synaptotagmin-7-like n=1 Tax=Limulus polyphemus TaxID=6850 RepID=A0ABM1AZP4_LIMPO|nr:synaptotagmin-7-like [Limulus polyphemus]